MKKAIGCLLLAASLFTVGCSRQILKVAPGRVEVEATSDQPSAGWVFWVRDVSDRRALNTGTIDIGQLDQRFDEEPVRVQLEKPPAEYMREQLALFLLNAGMEASSPEKAITRMSRAS